MFYERAENLYLPKDVLALHDARTGVEIVHFPQTA
jgi:hypothetical protein